MISKNIKDVNRVLPGREKVSKLTKSRKCTFARFVQEMEKTAFVHSAQTKRQKLCYNANAGTERRAWWPGRPADGQRGARRENSACGIYVR